MSLSKLSKKISYILRHHPESIGVSLEKEGWVNVSILLKSLNLTRDMLDNVVKTDNKGRYEYDETGTKIRARQGHSVKGLDLGYAEKEPPEYLYHGTAATNLDSIFNTGIKKMARHHVHLSLDEQTAKTVGGRHGKPVILRISSGQMHAIGIKFYLSNNNVWLTDYVDPRYISIVS